jgi:membrane-associated phospholipid phosphatase
VLTNLASWTYWHSEFTVVGLAMLWIYLRRNDAFVRIRNTVLLANVIGLVGYVLLPTAPPRMFPYVGFEDTLANFATLNHGSGLVQLASNPYAAMPSLHAADALIVGIALAMLVRNRLLKAVWLLWPGWVWFCVMATGNHFWLDIAAGVAVAAVAAAAVYRRPLRRALRPARAEAPLAVPAIRTRGSPACPSAMTGRHGGVSPIPSRQRRSGPLMAAGAREAARREP